MLPPSSMITRVFSAAVVGIDATEIEIEVNTGPGEPSIVGAGPPCSPSNLAAP